MGGGVFFCFNNKCIKKSSMSCMISNPKGIATDYILNPTEG